jgi:hypothetical protein
VIVAPNVEVGRDHEIFALAVVGLVESQASLALTERTALAAVIGAAFAAWAGAINETATTAAMMLAIKRRDLFTASAYSSNLGIT